MSNPTGLPLTGRAPPALPDRISTVDLTNEERFNVPSVERQSFFITLESVIGRQGLPTQLWAVLHICDIRKLEWIVQLANLSAIFSEAFRNISTGFPFNWTFLPPLDKTTFSEIPPPADALSSWRAGYSRRAIWDAKRRDGSHCVLTGNSKSYDAVPIFPSFTGKSRLSYDQLIPDFWKYVEVFWGHATAERWEKAAFKNPNNPDAPVNDCTNMICLRKDLRAAWLDALFALRPYAHKSFENIPTTTRALSSERLIGMNGMVVMVGEGDQRRPIESGYRFKMATHNPETHPLPSWDLLDIQWHLTRIVAMCSAARYKNDDCDSDDSDESEPEMAVALPRAYGSPRGNVSPSLPRTSSYVFGRPLSPVEEEEEYVEDLDFGRDSTGPLPGSEADQPRNVDSS
ncbi:uncharacterized protein N7515_000282 [Penicillium bovifimosum]|uniref:HNH nuclease domain-containing protein n=1 Tax=Penicillium bovifimosum TaxID=126998 RepID=A0A9W9LBF0_9EURO|nr:uncharacterized protein N7515_000282 [Penicillium bovifimosum]KAJ5145718.1 hypothetical protein N7515_000282 [Penicillium bovifimosum]